MTHKILKLVVIVIIPFIFSSCGVSTKDWSIVRLDTEITIKVPPVWILTKVDGKIVFSDFELDQPNAKIYMMEVDVESNSPNDVVIYSNSLFYGVEIKVLKSEMSSDSTFYSISKVEVDHQVNEYRFLEYNWRDGRMLFVVMDSNLKTTVLKTILHSVGND